MPTHSISESSDAYSFGIMVLELLCGKLSTQEDCLTDFFEDDDDMANFPVDEFAFDKVHY